MNIWFRQASEKRIYITKIVVLLNLVVKHEAQTQPGEAEGCVCTHAGEPRWELLSNVQQHVRSVRALTQE